MCDDEFNHEAEDAVLIHLFHQLVIVAVEFYQKMYLTEVLMHIGCQQWNKFSLDDELVLEV